MQFGGVCVGLAVAASMLAGAVAAEAATVKVNAAVAAGSTFAVASLSNPSFAVTLDGDDQTGAFQAELQVVDARGLAKRGGWNLTIGAGQFSDGAGHVLPADADTIASVAAGCHSGSTCNLPANTVANTGLAVPQSPTRAKFFNATTGTGLGRIDVTANVNVLIPANTIAGRYSSTLTVALSAGP